MDSRTPEMGLTLVTKGSVSHRAVVGEDATPADLTGLDGEVTVVTDGRAVRTLP